MKSKFILILIIPFLSLAGCGMFQNSKVLVPAEAAGINTYCAQLRALQADPTADVNAFQMQIRAEHDAALKKAGATGKVRIICD